MKFLISTANYNSEEYTKEFLASINNFAMENKKHKYTVQVFDNSATIGNVATYEYIDAHIIKPKRNIGLAPSWKISINTAKENDFDVLVLVNNDTIFSDNFFDIVSSAVENDPSSAYGPFITLENHSPWSTGGNFGFLPWIVKHEANSRGSYVHAIFETKHLSGCCIILPVQLLRDNENIYKGLSDFFFRGEEWFINKKLEMEGVNRYILRDSTLIHKENGSHSRFSEAHIYWAVRAKMLFIKKLNGFEHFLSLLTYSIHLFSKGLLFYKKNSSFSLNMTFCTILRAFCHGLKKSVIREFDF